MVVIDNLVTPATSRCARVTELSGRTADFHHVDLVDEAAVEKVFDGVGVDAVTSRGSRPWEESVREPLK